MALTKEQLDARKVGGTDVATILGDNPHMTARELYHIKRGELQPENLETNDAVEAGNVMEAPIATLVEKRLTRRWGRPVKLRRCNQTLVHPKYDWLTVHIDRDFVGLERGLEIKNVGPRAWQGWGEQDTAEIPKHYLPQPHCYMLVKNYPVWTVSSYFGGGDLRFYEIERSREIDELIIDVTHDFWQRVLRGDPPEIEPEHPRALELIKKLYPGTNGQTIEAPPGLLPWITTLQETNQLRIMFEKAEEIAKVNVLRVMGDNAILQLPDGSSYTRKVVHRDGYVAKETEYVDFRHVNPTKKLKGDRNGTR